MVYLREVDPLLDHWRRGHDRIHRGSLPYIWTMAGWQRVLGTFLGYRVYPLHLGHGNHHFQLFRNIAASSVPRDLFYPDHHSVERHVYPDLRHAGMGTSHRLGQPVHLPHSFAAHALLEREQPRRYSRQPDDAGDFFGYSERLGSAELPKKRIEIIYLTYMGKEEKSTLFFCIFVLTFYRLCYIID